MLLKRGLRIIYLKKISMVVVSPIWFILSPKPNIIQPDFNQFQLSYHFHCIHLHTCEQIPLELSHGFILIKTPVTSFNSLQICDKLLVHFYFPNLWRMFNAVEPGTMNLSTPKLWRMFTAQDWIFLSRKKLPFLGYIITWILFGNYSIYMK